MKHLDEYRRPELLSRLAAGLARGCRAARLMEVCGTHTMAIARFGLRQLLPAGVELISGPGCPVCVTPTEAIDRFIAIGQEHGAILATFGDMLRVPGSGSTLEKERAHGQQVRIVYSAADAVELARSGSEQVVFFGIGFETTAPGVALAVLEAESLGLDNFSVFCAHKLIPPALRSLLESGARIAGFLLPGHVSVITGSQPYRFVAEEFHRPCAIAGFEPADLLQGIEMLLRQIQEGRAEVEIAYRRAVRPEGNPRAREVVERVFEPVGARWRGLGEIPGSGLAFRPEHARFDAAARFPVDIPPARDHPGCRCGEVIQGLISPPECPLFGRACTPLSAVGPCMVSSEGACAAHYRYPSAQEVAK